VEAHRLHRGRLIDHVHLVVRDLAVSRRFYSAVLDSLGRQIEGDGERYFYSDELFVSIADEHSGAPMRIHLAFQAADRDAVHRFHSAGLAAGGKDHGGPGLRKYHPGYYAAFLIDPDGHNIEAVYHGPAQRSAESVVLTF
jgi:catechol 2,3-dioxygenase-like lactoylglutathione lyase family enzyme